MLQDIRQNIQGTAAKIVVWLIVIAFAGFGIESILLGGGSNSVAEVNGDEISPVEVQQMVTTQKRQLMAMLGDNIDPAMLDDQRLSAQALQTLIGQRLLVQSAQSLDLAVGERELGRVIADMEQFQVDGSFSPDLYKSLLAQAGYTPGSFKAALKQDLLVNQLSSGLAGSDFATPAELALAAEILAEQRDVRYLTLPLADFEADIEVSEAQVEQYYADREAEFYTPETVVLDYIELKLEDFFQPVDEDELLSMYEQEKNSYQYQTENRVSHILLTQGEDESEADYSARIAAVQAALDSGDDFAAIANEFSDDIGSASNGGDLGFSSGDAFPEEMEKAIAGLEVDEVSGAVETDAGTHFIKLTERRGGQPPSLAELRPELEKRLQEREAGEELLLTVESLRDIAFNAEDLAGPAEQLGLQVQRSEPVARNQSEGLFSDPGLLSAVFSEDVLELGHNSAVIELSPEHFVVARVNQHNQPALRPLETVREDIVAAIREEKARAAVMAKAEAAAERIREGEPVDEVAADLGYEWQVEIAAERNAPMLPRPVAELAFAMQLPADGESAVDVTLAPTGDAQVVEVSGVTPGDYSALPETRQQRVRQQVRGEFATLVQGEYQQHLRNEADISVY